MKPAGTAQFANIEPVPGLVSVIVPCYNCARFVREGVDSVLSQTGGQVEVIVVDDGSTDESAQILATYGDRIRVLTQKNAGVAAARNAGLRAARGEFIAFLDADDVWLPGKVAAQVGYLRRHADIGLVYANWRVWRPDDDGVWRVPAQLARSTGAQDDIDARRSGWLYNQLLEDCVIHTSSALMRRSLAVRVGFFDAALRCGEDYDYWLRASRETRIDKLTGCYSLYRMHAASVTSRPNPVSHGAFVIERAVATWGYVGPDGSRTEPRRVRDVVAKLWFDLGYQNYRAGDPRTARRCFVESLKRRPAHLRGWLRLALATFA
jgi:glycosyltransferase involved in cell wall biosynthesis